MKAFPHRPILLSLALLAGLVAAPSLQATAAAPRPAAPAPNLQVYVNVPIPWRPFLQENLARILADHVRHEFVRHGYKGTITWVEESGDVKAALPELSIRLIEWRLDHVGNVDCTFGATLKTLGQVKNLGLFSNTQFTWAPAVDQWQLGNAFDDAASGAMNDLARQVAKTGLLAGFPATPAA